MVAPFAYNNGLTAMLQRTGKIMNFGLNYIKTLFLIGPVHLKQRKRWISVLDEILREIVEPGPSLWSRDLSHRRSTHRVETGRSRVASSITLTTYFDISYYQKRRSWIRHTRLSPDQSINQGVVSGSSWARSKASVFDVAPLAPFGPDRELAGAALVDDEVGGDSLGREEGGEGIDVVGFVPRVTPLGEVLTGNSNVSCTVISASN